MTGQASTACPTTRAIFRLGMNFDRIKIFVTGGTFDKEYNEITAELYFNQTHVADMRPGCRAIKQS